MPNNGAASGGSNFGPTNPALMDASRDAWRRSRQPILKMPRRFRWISRPRREADSTRISAPPLRCYQAGRVARERHMDVLKVRELVLAHVEAPQWGIFGEARVNVLLLNLALDRAQ